MATEYAALGNSYVYTVQCTLVGKFPSQVPSLHYETDSDCTAIVL